MKMPRSFDRGTIAERATIAGRIQSRSARRRRSRMKLQGESIHAVAQAGRLRPIVENVTEVTAAAAAVNFGPQHSEGAVFALADGVFERLPKTRPAGAALIFRCRGEQRQIAAGTGEDALAMLLEQRACPRSFGAFLAQDFILLRRQLRAPFRVGLFDLEFLLGTGRGASQPAQGSKAQESGGGREQDTAVDHDDGLRAKRNTGCSLSDTGRRDRRYTGPGVNFSLSCECAIVGSPSAEGTIAGGLERSARGRPGGGRVPACRSASARRI